MGVFELPARVHACLFVCVRARICVHKLICLFSITVQSDVFTHVRVLRGD